MSLSYVRKLIVLTTMSAAGAAIALTACSTTSTPTAPETAAQSLAAGFCGALHACCDTAKVTYEDDACMADMVAFFQPPFSAVRLGYTIYDAAALDACVQAWKANVAQCGGTATDAAASGSGGVDPVTAACFPLLKGTLAPGASCTVAIECAAPDAATTAFCAPDLDPKSATYKQNVCGLDHPRGVPGAACGAVAAHERADCDSSLGACVAGNGDDGRGVCQAYANDGDSCASTGGTVVVCKPTSICDFQTLKCTPLPAAGQPCVSFACASGSYCDTTVAKPSCAARLPEGGRCRAFPECESFNCDFSTADGSPFGACTAVAPVTSGITPRACSFGPLETGFPVDASAVAPAMAMKATRAFGLRAGFTTAQ